MLLFVDDDIAALGSLGFVGEAVHYLLLLLLLPLFVR
jgi:hypothetical protein